MIICPEAATTSQSAFSLAILMSGAAGVVLTLIATFYLDRKNETRALQAELRRHRVNRLITATDGLRSAFFTGLTLLEYHRVELAGIESELERKKNEIGQLRMNTTQYLIDGATKASGEKSQIRLQGAIIRYNTEVSKIEASAKSFVESLNDPILPAELYQRLRITVGALIEGSHDRRCIDRGTNQAFWRLVSEDQRTLARTGVGNRSGNHKTDEQTTNSPQLSSLKAMEHE